MTIKVYVIDYGRKYLVMQWIDPTTGKRCTETTKCTKRREAERVAAERERELNAAVPKGDGSLPFDDFVLLYEESHLASLAAASRYRSLSVLSIFREIIHPATIAHISTGSIVRFVSRLRTSGSPKKTAGKGQGVSETTLRGYLATLRAALSWAKEAGHLAEVPRMPRITRAIKAKPKGRPLTGPEFVAMLRAVRPVVGRAAARSWRRLLVGLWLSGLRLAEALELSWDNHAGIWIDTTSSEYPLFGITAAAEKGFQNRLMPLTPDFGRRILRVPQSQRSGPVFPLVKARYKGIARPDYVSKVITKIGRHSGVVVSADGKYASAHDLRRSFGLRWSHRVMPSELMLLMRHNDVSTSLNYYALMAATEFGRKMWSMKTGDSDTTPNTTLNKKT